MESKRKRRKKEEVEQVRREALKVIKKGKLPSATEIINELNNRGYSFDKKRAHKFVQNILEPLVYRGLVYKIEQREGRIWARYANTEQARTVEFREFFDNLLTNLKEVIRGKEKEEINKEVNEIILLLSKFEFINNPKKVVKWKAHRHLKNGKIEWYEPKHPLRFLNQKEIKEMGWIVKNILLRKKGKYTKEETKELEKRFEKETKEGTEEIDDSDMCLLFNKICDRLAKTTGSYEEGKLSGTIMRKITNIQAMLCKKFNLINIANRIYKEMRKRNKCRRFTR